jgi:uncharacterized protein YeaO (DUF488 family)
MASARHAVRTARGRHSPTEGLARRRVSSAGTQSRRQRPLSVQLKRAYDPPSPADGARVLVDRVWPRGMRKDAMGIDAWLPDLGPSAGLRQWFGHDPKRWTEFRRRYRQELAARRPLLDRLAGYARHGRLTLVFSARDVLHNQAVVIKEMLGRTRTPLASGD